MSTTNWYSVSRDYGRKIELIFFFFSRQHHNMETSQRLQGLIAEAASDADTMVREAGARTAEQIKVFKLTFFFFFMCVLLPSTARRRCYLRRSFFVLFFAACTQVFVDDELKSRADEPLNRLANEHAGLHDALFTQNATISQLQARLAAVKAETLTAVQPLLDQQSAAQRIEVDDACARTVATIKPQLVTVQAALQTLKHEWPRAASELIRSEVFVSVQPKLAEHDAQLDQLAALARRGDGEVARFAAALDAAARAATDQHQSTGVALTTLMDGLARVRADAAATSARHDAGLLDVAARMAALAAITDAQAAKETEAREDAVAALEQRVTRVEAMAAADAVGDRATQVWQ